jgi:hypothetical protein
MTDEEVLRAYDEMLKEWNGNLPNPIQEPIRFAHYVKMYKFYKERDSNANQATNN